MCLVYVAPLSTINGTILAVTVAAVVTIVRESELRVDGNIYGELFCMHSVTNSLKRFSEISEQFM